MKTKVHTLYSVSVFPHSILDLYAQFLLCTYYLVCVHTRVGPVTVLEVSWGKPHDRTGRGRTRVGLCGGEYREGLTLVRTLLDPCHGTDSPRDLYNPDKMGTGTYSRVSLGEELETKNSRHVVGCTGWGLRRGRRRNRK